MLLRPTSKLGYLYCNRVSVQGDGLDRFTCCVAVQCRGTFIGTNSTSKHWRDMTLKRPRTIV